MNQAQYIEEVDYSASARHDRFDGFDRGDLGRDDEADQNAMNDAEEDEYDEAGRPTGGALKRAIQQERLDRMYAGRHTRINDDG